MEFGPDATTGTEGEQADALATVAECHHKQTGASVLAAVGIAHPWSSAVIHLRFLTRLSNDHRTRWFQFGWVQFVNEAFDALIAVREAVVGDQILVDGRRIPAST